MTIGEIVRQGFHYTRTGKSLWLFGFFVGIASGGSNGGGGGNGGGLAFSPTQFAVIAAVLLAAVAVVTVMRFVGEGALIEGIVRARQGGVMTTGEGFRAGWAHWGVLLRIALLYLAATFGSIALLAAPCLVALQTLGPVGAVLLGIPALVIAVPWLATLYLLQAFAWRIAVLEHRHALDAIAKARLFLHGRIGHGLKLLVAAFVGTLAFVVVGVVVIAPLVLLIVASIRVLPLVPVIVLGCVVLLPLLVMLAAATGTFRSAVWTIGYVTQVES
jgi:hypothetical protein